MQSSVDIRRRLLSVNRGKRKVSWSFLHAFDTALHKNKHMFSFDITFVWLLMLLFSQIYMIKSFNPYTFYLQQKSWSIVFSTPHWQNLCKFMSFREILSQRAISCLHHNIRSWDRTSHTSDGHSSEREIALLAKFIMVVKDSVSKHSAKTSLWPLKVDRCSTKVTDSDDL